MKKGKNRRKLNDLGMSLIEILVAIAILAIVTGPILHSFVTAIKLNAKAKEKQRVTTAAQSIMEGFKAYNLEELCRQFYDSQGVADLSTSGTFYVVKNVARVYETDAVGNPASSIVTVPDGAGLTEQFTANADNKYFFTLEGLNYEGRTYDAKVELEPLMSADIVSMKDVVIIEDFDVDTTALYDQESPNLDSNVFNNAIPEYVMANDWAWKPETLYEWYGMTEDEVREGLISSLHIVAKTTRITIGTTTVWDPGIGADVTKFAVTISVKYDWASDEYHYEYIPSWGTETQIGTIQARSGSVYYSSDGKAYGSEQVFKEIYPAEGATKDTSKLKTISFCYYPVYDYDTYGVNGITVPNETIEICNNTGREINVSIIKQKNPNISSNVELRTLEEAYHPTVNTAVGWGSGGVTTDGSNLTENLADAITSSGDMLSTKPNVLIYSVKISVYESGEAALGFTGEPLVVLDGTMNN